MKTIFSLKALGVCWAGLLAGLGAGAVALQLTMPRPAPVVVAAAPLVAPLVTPVPAAPPAPAPLFAMLPPPRPMARLQPALPVPPVPPVPSVRRVVRAEPHRPAMVYVAEPALDEDPGEWGRPTSFPSLYARGRPYAYPGPRTYYGW